MNVNLLNGGNFFDINNIPICVMIAEHKEVVKHHTHSFFEFVYIHQGFSTHYYNNVTTLLTPGDVFGICPGDVHGYTRPNRTILYNCLFDARALENEMEELQKLPGVGQILNMEQPSVWQRIRLDPIARNEAVEYLEMMRLEGLQREKGWELKLKSLLIQFLVLFSRAFQHSFIDDGLGEYIYAEYMFKALDFIEENYTQSIFVDDIADSVGLSTDYFSRMFKQFTGITPSEYIKNVRLAKATELLREHGVTIASVAEEVGFDDPAYFTRQFKQILGITPSQYQRENGVRG
jgi:AraC-like DNA-binding protein